MSLAQNGRTVLATVNPMSSDRSSVDAFHFKLSSAVPNYIILQSRTDLGSSVRYEGVLARRRDRKERPFTFSGPKPGYKTDISGARRTTDRAFSYTVPILTSRDTDLTELAAQISSTPSF
jgi:hypothetical protein